MYRNSVSICGIILVGITLVRHFKIVSGPNPNSGWFKDVVKAPVIRSILQIHWLWSYSFQCKYVCISVKFWSNSDFSKTPITPHVSCHVLVMSWEHNGSIFDAALVGK